MDTRESGPWLAAEVAGGLAERGVVSDFAGVTTTPGIAYLAKNGPFAAGVMISASHNPYQDNGIKLIGHSGYKFPDEQEESLEKEIFSLLERGVDSAPASLDVDQRSGPQLHRSFGRHACRRVWAGCASWPIAPTDRHRAWHPSCSNGWARAYRQFTARRTGGISISIAVRCTWSRYAPRCSRNRPTWAWPLTAMPIARCSFRAPVESSMATRCCCSRRDI